MNAESKRMILEQRRALLREHIEIVGGSPGFERALEKVEAELAQLGQPEPTPQQGS